MLGSSIFYLLNIANWGKTKVLPNTIISTILLLTSFYEYLFKMNMWKPCIFNTRLVVELSPPFLSKQR